LQLLLGVHFFVFNCLYGIEFSSELISEYWNQSTTLLLLKSIYCNIKKFKVHELFILTKKKGFNMANNITTDFNQK